MLRLGRTWEADMGQGQGQGCQMVIMCQELCLSRLSIEMTGSGQLHAVTNLNCMV